MKNKLSKMIFLLTAVIGLVLMFGSERVDAFSTSKTTGYYQGVDGGVTITRPKDRPPIYITFNNHPTYSKTKKFWFEQYQGGYSWYSPVPPSTQVYTKADLDRYQIVENRTNDYGEGGAYMVDNNFSWNLKSGRVETVPGERSKFMGVNSGTTKMVVAYKKNGRTYNYIGKNYEWRYLGYNPAGEPVHNPYFPPDRIGGSDNMLDRGWIKDPHLNPLTKNESLATQSEYDVNFTRKVEWFKKYFFTENPQFRRSGKTLQQDAEYWSRVFLLQNNPDWSTGIAVGYHYTGGNLYYMIFSLESPPKPNIRLTYYQIVDQETGELVATFNRTAGSNSNMKYAVNKVADSVVAGRTYKIQANLKNMDVPKLDGRDTQHWPVGLDTMYALDENAKEFRTYNEINLATREDKYSARADAASIEYGEAIRVLNMMGDSGVPVQWTYTVPEDAKELVTFRAEIPFAHYLMGENDITEDDWAEVTMPVLADDIATGINAELIDSKGRKVDYVEAGETYKVRMFISKFFGSKSIGSNNPNNPYASLDVTLSDGKRSYKQNIATNKVLRLKGDVGVVETTFTPSTPHIKATWQIAQKHRTLKQSTDPTNDGPYSREWNGMLNFSVYDLKANPPVLRLEPNESSTRQDMNFSFRTMNENPEGKSKTVQFVAKKGSSVIARFNRTIPANTPTTITFSAPNQYMTQGTQRFSVEVNPAPRDHIEYLPKGANPYGDNIAYANVIVAKNADMETCDVRWTQNNWSEKFSVSRWEGEYEYYWVRVFSHYQNHYGWIYRSDGSRYWGLTGRTPVYRDEQRRRIVTKPGYPKNTTDTRSHYERFTIDEVLFRSTETNGWVNIKYGTGKVKAGYGFELKFVTRYESNVVTNRPSSWNYTLSSQTVSPNYSITNAPSRFYVEVPFQDPKNRGQKATYALTGPSKSGVWYQRESEYQMPTWNDEGYNTREIMVPDDVRQGRYPVRINTQPFYGSFDKPYTSRMLCDELTVQIEVVGASEDDTNSHITH